MALLRNRVAVITGSTRGLGLAMAEAYARAGACVVISARDGHAVEEVKKQLTDKGLKVEGVVCDVCDPMQVEELASTTRSLFGFFDLWVNNAAIVGPVGPAVEIPPQEFLRVCHTNVEGVYYGSRVALQHFLQRKRGKLINVIGLSNDFKAEPLFAAYASSKAWVRTFTQSLAQEHKGSGIGIYALQPPLMHTALMTKLQVIEPYEPLLAPLKQLLETWGHPPRAMVAKALWLAAQAPLKSSGLELAHQGFSSTLLQTLQHWLKQKLNPKAGAQVEFEMAPLPSARHQPLYEEEEWDAYW